MFLNTVLPILGVRLIHKCDLYTDVYGINKIHV